MTGENIVALSIGILGFASTFIGIIWSRRKWATEREKILAEAEQIRSAAAGTDVDAFDKFTDLLTKHQTRNDQLYHANVALEKENTDLTRNNELLVARLEARDAQLSASTKQLDLLRDLAKQAPVTDTLKNQLEAMNQIVSNLQTAQSDMQEVLKTREAAFNALFESTRSINKQERK